MNPQQESIEILKENKHLFAGEEKDFILLFQFAIEKMMIVILSLSYDGHLKFFSLSFY